MSSGKLGLKGSKLLASMALLATVAGCSQTTGSIGTSISPHTSGPQCHRSVPLSEFDETCDEPRLGFKGFSPLPIVTGL
ncbi:hypothetical protein [Mesorhizobium captivum]|uniref:hypothetical protein n=1 Tax=Mesorhizobium captivum TaxID=3072319 RepID=UPI002A241D26|nr:hypothetical protein [Mesorhizobium sp. VK3C]MDX8449404.1 hypothetical protein [Mesorhizobium sp. VK3C]